MDETKNLMPVRVVDVPKVRNALSEAAKIMRHALSEIPPAKRDSSVLASKTREWLVHYPEVMNALPQTYEPGDLVTYELSDGQSIDGVILAVALCPELYVVGPGDDRNLREGRLWLMPVSKIRRRG